jgi:DNA-binding PadR family transcriptional regulator
MIPRRLAAASIKPLLLSILAEDESYGYAIIERVKSLTDGRMEWTPSTLYPVLHSLENDGLLKSRWQESPDGPKRKYYGLTRNGEKALVREKQHWLDVHRALVELWGPGPGLTISQESA